MRDEVVEQRRAFTFLFRGEAQEVTLQHWIHGLPGSMPFRRLRHGDTCRGTMICDPVNKHTARGPFGANSVVYVERYSLPGWSLEDTEARKGTIEERYVDSKVYGDWRPIKVAPSQRYLAREPAAP